MKILNTAEDKEQGQEEGTEPRTWSVTRNMERGQGQRLAIDRERYQEQGVQQGTGNVARDRETSQK